MKLIDKAAVVEEIEKRIKVLQNLHNENEKKLDSIQKAAIFLCIGECEAILSLLDALEVKDVDLEKELDTWRHNHFHGRRDKDAAGEYLERSSQLDIAEYFFNLGLVSQLSWKDVKRLFENTVEFMVSSESNDLSEEKYYTEILKNLKFQKRDNKI